MYRTLFPDAIFQPRFPFEKYLFYRDLGYSVKAARLLSELSYGDRALAFRIKRLGGQNPLAALAGSDREKLTLLVETMLLNEP